jgi:putative DNA primase/helicase
MQGVELMEAGGTVVVRSGVASQEVAQSFVERREAGDVGTFQEIASRIASRGIPVIPIPPGQKGCALKRWPEQATTDAAKIAAWNMQNPRYNCGAVAGASVWMLDCDIPDLAERAEAETGEKLLRTFTVRSSKGKHLYFCPTEASCRMGNIKVPGLFDCQVKNKYVVAPGSLHPSGIRYEIIDNSPIVEAPNWLIDWLVSKSSKNASRTEGEGTVAQGGRNIHLTSIAGSLRCRGVAYEAAKRTLVEKNEKECVPALSHEEVGRILASVWRYPAGGSAAGEPIQLTDLGNARRLANAERGTLLYCHVNKTWFLYDGVKWATDRTDHVMQRAKKVVQSMMADAATISDDEKRQALVKHELRSEAGSRLEAMVRLARGELPVTLEEFDSDPMLLNCQNGTLDLRTLEFRKHRREDLITKVTGAEYDPRADCPFWRQFLGEVTAQNDELVGFLQRCAGYSLTGQTHEHAMFLLYGAGANGKTTYLEVLRHVFGDYAATADFSSFTASKFSTGPRNDLAKLQGSRFVIATETEEGSRIAESLLKQMTGGDTVTARFLYKEHFEFKPQFKLWLATNHKPGIHGTDDGIWRRIRLIPFTVCIPDERRDRQLCEKLKGESAGILRWTIDGLREYQKTGLKNPAIVNDATGRYREKQDTIGHFLASQCIEADGLQVQARLLYDAYKAWAKREAGALQNERQFAQALARRGLRRMKSASANLWRGVSLAKSVQEQSAFAA